MPDVAVMEKFAGSLAKFATTGDNSEFVKLAQEHGLVKKSEGEMQSAIDYLSKVDPRILYSLAGAGAGGLIGLLQGKNRGRNALWYALTGGLTGLGLGMFSGSSKPGAGAAENAAGGSSSAGGASPEAAKEIEALTGGAGLNPTKTPTQLTTGAGTGLAAGIGTSRLMRRLGFKGLDALDPSEMRSTWGGVGKPTHVWGDDAQKALTDFQRLRNEVRAVGPGGIVSGRRGVANGSPLRSILDRGRIRNMADAETLSRALNSDLIDPNPAGTARAATAAIADGKMPPSYRGAHIPARDLYEAALRGGGRTGRFGRFMRGAVPLGVGFATGSIAAENAPRSLSGMYGNLIKPRTPSAPQGVGGP